VDRFEDRRTNAVTFKGKMGLPIHRWYRLTPSFSPALALDIAEHFGLGTTDYVLDPFSGVGTVPLCMKYEGIPACSIELNPYLHFVSTVKTRIYTDLPDIARCFDDFVEMAEHEASGLQDEKRASEYLATHDNFIPPIHKPERWWSPANLAQLVAIRRSMLGFEDTDGHVDLLRLGILGILIPVSNAKHNHVSLTFADEPLPTVDVVDTLRRKLDVMMEDLESVRGRPCSDVTVYAGNSKAVDRVLPRSPKASAVITSPPYPNRFSYARETRPHLFFFEFIEDAKSVGQLEIDAIGGTWGKATSVLMSGVEPINDVVGELLSRFTANVNGNGQLMANYVVKYFNNMFEHAEGISKVCRKHAKLAYVIGNSKFFDNPLPSDEILAGIFDHFGFSLDGISKMRRRQSKSGLYEAVVFMSR
jgi:hypothetical protein